MPVAASAAAAASAATDSAPAALAAPPLPAAGSAACCSSPAAQTRERRLTACAAADRGGRNGWNCCGIVELAGGWDLGQDGPHCPAVALVPPLLRIAHGMASKMPRHLHADSINALLRFAYNKCVKVCVDVIEPAPPTYQRSACIMGCKKALSARYLIDHPPKIMRCRQVIALIVRNAACATLTAMPRPILQRLTDARCRRWYQCIGSMPLKRRNVL